PDAGPPDATVPSDAFDVPDAGMGGGMTGGGCGCRVVTSTSEPRGLVGLAAIALALFARARRRRAQR
ncbi:MAG: hypothetical protein K1X94_25385, partial [Sandaracinaceae bacterium]|nr:hypothetical protein [Sandaracinaceae bacterium]